MSGEPLLKYPTTGSVRGCAWVRNGAAAVVKNAMKARRFIDRS